MNDSPASTVHRFEVRPSERAGDPLGAGVLRAAHAMGVACQGVRTARVYMIQAALDGPALERIASRLLADPVLERARLGASPADPGERVVEVHPLPGVMDPAAQTLRDALRELTGLVDVEAATGTRYDLAGVDEPGAQALARRLLANTVIEAVHFEPWTPASFPRAHPADQSLRRVALDGLDDGGLEQLSRRGHLFLSLAEMRAVQAHYRSLGRRPTDVELETIAQTWSEHCVHKTLKSTVNYRSVAPHEGPRVGPGGGAAPQDPITWEGRPGVTMNADGSVTIKNLLKSTVAAATHELIRDGLDWALSVFVDNAGVIAFDEHHAINVKVETHNRPSAIEPYGGAATGIGGCIRDVMGTGLGAKPIASTDVFCVANPGSWVQAAGRGQNEGSGEGPGDGLRAARPLPPGVLHPRRVLVRVIDGVRDYGNRMGIPTVNGAVSFDDRYVGNPLVFCGCVGVMPRDKIRGEPRAGDRVIAMGGRTGKDGIHGATFSSAELTDTHADEFSHAVQIGNAIQEKRVLDAILRARDFAPAPGAAARCLFSAITDCGAGGFSSAVGEMGARLGAQIHLDRAPLKYDALRYDEIWISESQERMVLSVPPENLAALRAICDEEGVEIADLGVFGTPTREIILHFRGEEVGRLSCDFLHEGIPMPVREAVWQARASGDQGDAPRAAGGSAARANGDVRGNMRGDAITGSLLALLAHPNIASKRWIVRQYDHEVQGNTLIKPLVGPGGIGPGDASVIQPVPGSKQGLAIACGLATPVGDPELGGDPYFMALAAVDECVRNLVCVGADPSRIAILDNFCWPSCDKPQNMAALVRAAVGCYDAAKAYRAPFVSGKDSLNNQFRYKDPAGGREITIEIPPTLLITGIGIVPDVGACVTMDFKRAGNRIALLTTAERRTPMIGSHFQRLFGLDDVRDAGGVSVLSHNRPDPAKGRGAALAMRELQSAGVVRAAHDVSEGGVLTAVAEMLIASGPRRSDGAELGAALAFEAGLPDVAALFAEPCHSYVLEIEAGSSEADLARVVALAERQGAALQFIGTLTDRGALEGTTGAGERFGVAVPDLRRAFLGTLDW